MNTTVKTCDVHYSTRKHRFKKPFGNKKYYLSCRFKFNRTGIPPQSVKRIIKQHLTSSGLGELHRFVPDISVYRTVPATTQRTEFGFRFFVGTDQPDQTIADLMHILRHAKGVVGNFTIGICGTKTSIVAPSLNSCQQPLVLGKLIKRPLQIDDGVATLYRPIKHSCKT